MKHRKNQMNIKTEIQKLVKEALQEQTSESQSNAQTYRMVLDNLGDAFMRLNVLRRRQLNPNKQILDAMDKIDAAVAQVKILIREDDKEYQLNS